MTMMGHHIYLRDTGNIPVPQIVMTQIAFNLRDISVVAIHFTVRDG